MMSSYDLYGGHRLAAGLHSLPNCIGIVTAGKVYHGCRKIKRKESQQETFALKGLGFRNCELKEFYLSYYLIEQKNVLIPMICIKPALVAYLERNNIFNFNKNVLGYVKTVMDSPALSISF